MKIHCDFMHHTFLFTFLLPFVSKSLPPCIARTVFDDTEYRDADEDQQYHNEHCTGSNDRPIYNSRVH